MGKFYIGSQPVTLYTNKALQDAVIDSSVNVNLEMYLDMIISGTYAQLPMVVEGYYDEDLTDIIDGSYV